MRPLPKPGERWVEGGKVYCVCLVCGDVVRMNKPLVGSFHLCAPRADCPKCGRAAVVGRPGERQTCLGCGVTLIAE